MLESPKMFNLGKMQKKGMAKAGNFVDILVGILVAAILVVEFAPDIFGNTLNGSGAPSWLVSVFPIILAVAVLYLILRLLKKSK